MIELEYHRLLVKYNTLKSSSVGDVAVIPDARESMVDAYNLVLVDAHSHNLKDNYLHGAENGGEKAAAVLIQAATEYLMTQQSSSKTHHMKICVYANLKKLSVEAANQYATRNRCFGKPSFPRSLGAFAAGFSRNHVSVDYIDVADDEAVERKICGLFEMHIKDPACSQILFCASGSAQYVRTLKKHISFAKKITLVQRGSEDTSLTNLGLRGVMLPQIFESFSGNEAASKDLKDTRNGFEVTFNEEPLKPQPTGNVCRPPQHASESIPINASGDRIDKHMDVPTKAQWREYEACIATKKLCTMFYSGHGCSANPCPYYHGQISANERHCLRYLMRALPCRNAGKCRDAFCMRGHMCHYKECKKGTVPYCKMPSSHHGIDPNVQDWVTPNVNSGGEQNHEVPDPKGGATTANLIDL
ncbi:hypothetical protein COCMIDRAFT_99784 [Bipolaris oryzae ATCC 44560]|uniref:C3H1-type domain-containing protein n=1 Tax=Bipolaris oryzae ATCC 44560 TaxID=930090 RepID=W6Z1L8_COCMI|nr:uncharacterized protein COCMIDRAFT_99784 [Bipolaris oryzae ATCC 44560]EUC43845.1 hypothetical protein COCMIDRAFT_99784 [Bipolaris oryzae ATCC 44560]